MLNTFLQLILIGNLIWGAMPSPTPTQDGETVASLRLRALAAAVEAGEARALEDFWREVGPAAELERRVDAVYDRTLHILDEAASRGVTPLAVADRVVADRLCVETAAAGGGP